MISIWPAAARYEIMSCDELAFIYKNITALQAQFPACRLENGVFAPNSQVVTKSHLGGVAGPNNPSLEVSFATAGFLALILHAIGVEVYLQLTPRESKRLRGLSFERQLARGMRNPGSAVLVMEMIGDADAWVPKSSSRPMVVKAGKHPSKIIAALPQTLGNCQEHNEQADLLSFSGVAVLRGSIGVRRYLDVDTR